MLAENSFHHPQRRDQHMNGIRKKRRLIPLDHMPQSGQAESRGNQQEPDNPVKPDDNKRREPNRNGNHVERPVHRVRMCVVVVIKEAQGPPRCLSQDYSAGEL